ncbi:hypothetical protein CGC20_17615 [Leishmania donovani]|uniref:Uncharacterized protein n=1 Tax=Leishmania donovani TaxID=5661 RepID=A0A504XNP3_LEIDO|nr:hypothetical protein CGC20_2625 [Leishmania donovani]TPP49994.1 hypothetical protein CGC20_17615 [Leishmania donovani]
MSRGKLNEHTQRQCNKCPTSLVDEALNVTPRLCIGAALGLEPSGRFPLMMLRRREGALWRRIDGGRHPSFAVQSPLSHGALDWEPAIIAGCKYPSFQNQIHRLYASAEAIREAYADSRDANFTAAQEATVLKQE